MTTALRTVACLLAAVLFLAGTASLARADGGEDRRAGPDCRRHVPRHDCDRASPGPDANGDGRITNYERIRQAQADRWARHG